MQSQLRQEAAALAIEQQLKEKEAIEAATAAQLAKLAENEGVVRTLPAHASCALHPQHTVTASNTPSFLQA